MKNLFTKFAIAALLAAPLAGFLPLAASAENLGPITFEPSTYTVGNINGQDGWLKTGSYDANVTASGIPAGFGTQSLQISDAVTSGAFGDQTFAKPLTDSAGETASTNGTFSAGTKQPHFEMKFDIASVLPSSQQAGMHMSVSPDRGDGSRMSYLRFEDQADGIHVFFDDVTDAGPLGTVANFNETDIATITRTSHTIKLTMDFVDGPGNDVVKVYIDGVLKATGTSWEDYYRFDPESSSEQSPRIVKTVEFRESGTATPADAGKGFLIDNLSLSSGQANQICSTINLVSGSNSQTAGYTETTQAGPATSLLPASYSGGSFAGATPTQPVIPPWVDPSTDGNFSGSGALWISTHATWPGGSGNAEGSPSNDQWRLFEDSFTLPAGATVTSANLSFTADNATDVYLNGNNTPVSTTNDTYGPVPGAAPQYFASVFNTSFTPVVGNNKLDFVVRNWGGNFSSNPTGLLYKAVIKYCVPNTPPPTSAKVTIIKYLDNSPATAVSANNTAFPMHAIFPGGEGDYTLSPTGFNNPNPYQATTSDMPIGSNYSTFEKLPTTCDAGNPYALVGYSTGESQSAAASSTPTQTTPAFTNLTSDKFVIVWNKSCPKPAMLKVHILKYLDGQKATSTSAGGYQFPMTATWNAANIGAGSGNYVLGTNFGGAADLYGADTASMSAPADYTTSEVTGGTSNVLPIGAQCKKDMFRLKGYSASAVSFADAATQSITASAPVFTGLTSDRYVIVQNQSCNSLLAHITVQKVTVGGTGIFHFTGLGGENGFDLNTTGQPNNKVSGFFDVFPEIGGTSWTITESNTPGWAFTSAKCVYENQAAGQANGHSETVTLHPGQSVTCTFTNSKLGSISGMKFNDLNRNGKKDAGEPGLAGWTIRLIDSHGAVVATMVTDSSGNYSFQNLAPGKYKVREVHQNGWKRKTKNPGPITISPGSTVTQVNFGNAQKQRQEREDNERDDNNDND